MNPPTIAAASAYHTSDSRRGRHPKRFVSPAAVVSGGLLVSHGGMIPASTCGCGDASCLPRDPFRDSG